MRKYELSISADYVPDWGTTEAMREFFQNAIDEETRDSGNQMFFEYDPGKQIVRIGNKHSDLDIKTLLFGVTTKKNDREMIGNYGEGYKIATVVLLRLGKTVIFQNYCRKEVWRPRLVKSRKYDGILVPTFFVEQAAIWEKVPEHSLIVEIGGITPEEYLEMKEANLHLQSEVSRRETTYGSILDEEQYRGKIYVGGLFICNETELEVGINFKPRVVRIERDRSMVNSFDIKWYAARMVEELKDKELMKRSLNHYSGTYIESYRVPDEIKDEVATDFINQYGAKAVPVSNQSDIEGMKKRGYKAVIVSESKKNVIMESQYYADVREAVKEEKEKARPVYERFCEFIEKIESRLDEDETITAYGLAEEIEGIGKEEE